MKLRICYLYPDILNLYGDRGNVMCLLRRLAWRGIETELAMLPLGESAPLDRYDLFFIGGGQDFEQEILLEDLQRDNKAGEIIDAIESNKVFLAICGGFQMLGRSYVNHRGRKWDFIGALDMRTVGSENRMIGDYAFRCAPESGGHVIVGFENHSGRTYLGPSLKPLGTILRGNGNNGEDKTEGARYKNVFGTYAHGPILPKNPEFADYLLELALKTRYPEAKLPELDDKLELRAHNYMCARLGVEKSSLEESAPEPEPEPGEEPDYDSDPDFDFDDDDDDDISVGKYIPVFDEEDEDEDFD